MLKLCQRRNGIKYEYRIIIEKISVRALDINDVDIIYEMSCKNEIYYKYHSSFVTEESIVEDMKALPPNKSYDDKYYDGFFEGDSLVANMDLILGYPTEETAFIGLFMTNVRYQNKGVGSDIIKDVCNYLKQSGYRKARIGVDKGNPQSNSFWEKNGFYIISEKEYIVMEMTL